MVTPPRKKRSSRSLENEAPVQQKEKPEIKPNNAKEEKVEVVKPEAVKEMIDKEEEARYTTTISQLRSFLASPWVRLSIIMMFVLMSIVALCAARPFDRIVTLVLPDFDRNETLLAGRHHYYYKSPNDDEAKAELELDSPYTKTAITVNKSFAFRQCEASAEDGESSSSSSTILCCNGLENTCDLKINEVMFATVHKATSAKEDGALLQPNHIFSLESALQAGYRGLHLALCNCDGKYQFCHDGICHLGARNPTEVFLNMDRFLRDHRYEVLLIHLELNSNSNNNNNQVYNPEVQLSEAYDLMRNASLFSRHFYNHHSSSDGVAKEKDWPTLRTMIESNKRILLFYSNGPSCGNNTTSCPRGMHYWPDYAVETDVVQVNDGTVASSSCRIVGPTTSTSTGTARKSKFLAVNHFPAQPNAAASKQLNTFSVLLDRIEACSNQNQGRMVNLVSSDFWHLGSVVEVVQRQNKARTPALR